MLWNALRTTLRGTWKLAGRKNKEAMPMAMETSEMLEKCLVRMLPAQALLQLKLLSMPSEL